MYETKLLTISIDFTMKWKKMWMHISLQKAALNHERCANSVMINLIVRLPFHRVYCIEKLILFSR